MITLTIYYTLVNLDIATGWGAEHIILCEGYTEKMGLWLIGRVEHCAPSIGYHT